MKLEVRNLSIARGGREVLSNVSFCVDAGELVVLRGKNGAGKSSLLAALMGMDGVEVKSGEILVDDRSYGSYKTYERARAGMFLAHQEPPAIDGISLGFMARASLEAMKGVAEVPEAQRLIREASARIDVSESFTQKMLNVEMSGGEKKRAELFQLALLRPKVALLDEIDSGVDTATKELMLRVIAQLRSEGTAFVVVTHGDEFAGALKSDRTIEI